MSGFVSGLGSRRRACAWTIAGALSFAPLLAHAADEPMMSDRPRGSYVRMPDVLRDTPRRQRAPGERHIIYLNRCAGGLTLDAGWPDDNTVNRSGILSGTTNFPEYPFGDASWDQMVIETKEIFAPFNVEITDVDPSPMPHDEAVVCGSGALAGFDGAGGVSPFTCDVIDAPITFTFPESLGNDPRTIAEVIAQEAAHAWGLEHEYKCEDPMTYLYGCGEKSFQDGDFECGEYSPRACECGGATQNAFQYITDLFGSAMPDEQEPTAAITHPADGAVFGVGDDFEIAVEVADDGEVVLVELFLDGMPSTADMSDPFGPWPVTDAIAGSYELWIVATDAAGKTTQSASVHFEVTEDGAPPQGGDDGDDDDGDSASDDDEGDADDDGGGDDDATDDGTGGTALPPTFGLGAEEQGCACATRGAGAGGAGWLVVMGAVLRRGRRRSRETSARS